MLSSIKSWLVRMNSTKGEAWWWLVAALGGSLFVLGVGIALPFLLGLIAGSPFGVIRGSIADGFTLKISDVWIVALSPIMTFSLVFASLPIAQLGATLWNIGFCFACGYTYFRNDYGHMGHFRRE